MWGELARGRGGKVRRRWRAVKADWKRELGRDTVKADWKENWGRGRESGCRRGGLATAAGSPPRSQTARLRPTVRLQAAAPAAENRAGTAGGLGLRAVVWL